MTKLAVSTIVADQYVTEQFTKANTHADRSDVHELNAMLAVATHCETVARISVLKLGEALVAAGHVRTTVKTFQNRIGQARALVRTFGDSTAVFAALAEHNADRVDSKSDIVSLQGAYAALVTVKRKKTTPKPSSEVTSTIVIDSHNLADLSEEAIKSLIDSLADELMNRSQATATAAAA